MKDLDDVIGIDPELVIPDTSLSVYDHAIVPWKGTGMRKFHSDFNKQCIPFRFPNPQALF